MSFIDNIQIFLIPKKHQGDEEEFRKAKMLVNTLLLSIFFASFYLFNTIFFEMHYIMYNMVFCLFSFTFSLLLFKYGASRNIVANIFSAIALFCTAYDIYFSNGLFSWSFAWLSMSPVLALLLMNRNYGYFWLGASAVIGIIIGLLYFKGTHFPNDINPKYYPVMTLNASIGVILIMFFIALVLDNASNRSLERLNQKNQEIQWEKAIAEQERLRAEQGERFKHQFLANMSHEIRTPMNAIIGLSNILLNKKLSPEELNNHLKIIQLSSNNLQNIINDILDISKIEAGKIELEHIAFSVKVVAESVYQSFIHRAEEKEIKLTLDYDDTIPSVLTGDPTKLSQILSNLVSNAIKFTHKGEVIIKVRKDNEKLLFTVTDTGIGMTKDQMQVIFEPFRQADASTTRKYGGTGLGLYISKQLLILHKSDLHVYSDAGKGSTFYFSIEYSSNAIETSDTSPFIITDEMIRKMSGLKVLLAEDNEFNRIVATETLELKIPGVKIDFAFNGKEAVEKIPGHDIALMDVHMPELDGYEATQKIRSELSAPSNSIPIIALTASIIESDYNKCFKSGMDAIVTKPFNPNELLLTIYNALFDKAALRNYKTTESREQNGHVTNVEALKIFCNNNDERVKTYIKLYLDYTPENIAKLKKYMQEKDFKNMKMTAHTLKTHLKYMGMKSTAKLAEDFEEMCTSGRDLPALQKMMESIEKMCETSYTELKELV